MANASNSLKRWDDAKCNLVIQTVLDNYTHKIIIESKSVAHLLRQCSYPPVIWWLREYRKEIVRNETSNQLLTGGSLCTVPAE